MTGALASTDRVALFRALVTGRHEFAMEAAAEVLEGRPLIAAPHHEPICRALDGVIAGRITRLIVNLPPGYGKTLSCVWSLIARGLAINPGSRWLHCSYSSQLALDNSAKARQLVTHELWQDIRPIKAAADTDAKGLWRTAEGGGVRADAAAGSLTGFRAGTLGADGFSGAVVIDDPLKPLDSTSRPRRREVNDNFMRTIRSRVANEAVPIVVIMQRLCAYPNEPEPLDQGDLCEFLLRGGSAETWDHLELPALIDSARPYPAEWTHGRPIAHGLPDGPLWPEKMNAEDCARTERANPYVWAAQYQQRPKARSGDSLIRAEWFGRYDAEKLPLMRRVEVYADTASKVSEKNDYSVFLAAGLGQDGKVYVLDVLRSRWTIPQLHAVASDFWTKWRAQGARSISIEDASSGTYLIQALGQTLRHTVRGIRRTKDKFTRVSGIIEAISSGRVLVPINAPWVSAFLAEVEQFTDDDTHAHDDQIDALADAVEALLLSGSTYTLANVG